MNETRQLASFVAATSFDDLPRNVVDYAKVLVLDNMAAGFVGSAQPWSKMVADMTREAGGNEECTVFAQNWKTNPSGAALVNGVMIGAFESEHAAPIGAHPSGNVFPALLAIAERDHRNGKAFLTAMLLGYEAVCRIAEAATRAVEDERGYHTPATNGQFGAAIAVGKILDFDDVTLARAMGIAGSHCAGLLEFVWEGAMTKRLHLGRAGQMGLESAVLAAKGFTGPSTILEGKHGYLRVFSTVYRPAEIIQDIGKVWLTKTRTFIKPYSCHGTQQAVVQHLNDFKLRHRLNPKDIKRVVVSGSRSMIHLHDNQEPRSIMGVQYSMPFVVAIALARDATDPYVFDEKTLWDPEVRELAKKIETVIDERFAATYSPGGPHAEVAIEAGDESHMISVTGFKGMPETPFDFSDVSSKFRRFAMPAIGENRVEQIINKVAKLDELADMSELTRLIAV